MLAFDAHRPFRCAFHPSANQQPVRPSLVSNPGWPLVSPKGHVVREKSSSEMDAISLLLQILFQHTVVALPLDSATAHRGPDIALESLAVES